MGIPSFFRWLSDKYPHAITRALEDIPVSIKHLDEQGNEKTTTLPLDLTKPNPNGLEFDNLYLDMNGIIHPCCKPKGEEQPPTEELMIEKIFQYVDRVFALVRPRKLLFLAIDGVAPRAKQNQQRSRRYRTAKESKEVEELEESLRNDLIEKGIIPPPKKSHWDSNVITPGSKFMNQLAIGLRYYIHHRMATNEAWKNIKVILSDASVPGEGEHKIMNFIRSQRSQPGFEPNTRHVLHGLDADLIMLALGTHEYHFYILREQVFVKTKEDEALKNPDASEYETQPFQFLRVPILREYMEKEFVSLQYSLPFKYDLERVIDDFIFMCFFVGNDFLPHLPSLDIRDGAIDLLYNLYKKMLPTMGDYITHNGDVNLQRAQVLLQQLGNVENRIFKNKLQDQIRRESYRKRREADDLQRKAILNDPGQLHVLGRSTDSLKRPRESQSDVIQQSADENKKAAQAFLKNLFGKKTESEESKEPQEEQESAEDLEPKAKRARLSYTETNPNTLHATEDAASGQEADKDTPVISNAPEESAAPKEDASNNDAVIFDQEDENPPPKVTREMSLEEQKEHKERVKKVLDERSIVNEEQFPDDVLFGQEGWKVRYYKSKFNIEPNPALPEYQDIAQRYLEGLVWVYRYYFHGCASWNWFYPYHYAPFASDLAQVTNFEVKFTLGEPYKPFSQLMSVLPPDSAHALPTAFAHLMTDPNSIISDFYPRTFKIDLNGKKRSWQGVALLPFIEESRLLAAVAEVEQTLNAEERKRNTIGKEILFVHDANDLALRLIPLYLESKKMIKLTMKPDTIAGIVEPYEHNAEPDSKIEPPWQSTTLEVVPENTVVSALFEGLDGKKVFGLLPGLKPNQPILPQLELEYGYADSGRTNRTLERLLRDIENDRRAEEGGNYQDNRSYGRDDRDRNDRYRNNGRDNRGGYRDRYDNRDRHDNRDSRGGGYHRDNRSDNRDNRDNRDRNYDNRDRYDNRSYRGNSDRGRGSNTDRRSREQSQTQSSYSRSVSSRYNPYPNQQQQQTSSYQAPRQHQQQPPQQHYYQQPYQDVHQSQQYYPAPYYNAQVPQQQIPQQQQAQQAYDPYQYPQPLLARQQLPGTAYGTPPNAQYIPYQQQEFPVFQNAPDPNEQDDTSKYLQ